jgi:hypothetical protein
VKSKFIRVKHRETGDIASIPAGARAQFPDWLPDEGPVPDKAKPKKNLPSQPTQAAPAASNEKE